MSEFSFADLIAPYDLNPVDFLRTNKLFHAKRGNPHHFNSVFSRDDFFRFFHRNDILASSLQIVKDGSFVPFSDYSYISNASGTPTAFVNNRVAFEYFDAGFTFILLGIEYSIASLGSFYNRVASEIPCVSGLTGFYTPSKSQGLKPHFDDVDVFVMQLFGSKIWRVYDYRLPFATITADCPIDEHAPYKEFILNPGDTLFIPRGYVHSVFCTDDDSFHVSLSLTPFNWGDVLRFVASQMNDIHFRSPVYFDANDENVFSDYLIELFTTYFTTYMTDSSYTAVKDHFFSQISSRRVLSDNSYLDLVRLPQ